MANPYKLTEFDQALYDNTRKVWEKEVQASGLPSIQFHRVLDWTEEHRNYADGEEFSYAVVKAGEKHASAIVDLVFSRIKPKSAWLKMMDITLSPKAFQSVMDTVEGIIDATQIYGSAIAGSFILTAGKHKAKTVKLYGRSEALLTFLKSLAIYLKDDATIKAQAGLSIDMEGRWLVVKRR